MAQNFTQDWYSLLYNADAAFVSAENNDNALRTNFSGSNAPSFTIEDGVPWFDTDTGALKIRRQGAWVSSLLGDFDVRIWMWRNDVAPGWILESSPPSDVVLALAGGNYGAVGGVVVGNWAISGLTADNGGSHAHKWKDWTGVDDFTWDFAGAPLNMGVNWTKRDGLVVHVSDGDGNCQNNDYYTETEADHQHSISHNALWRPQAAVGTMQRPNLA